LSYVPSRSFFDKVFTPSSIAVVGASSDDEKERRIGWVGRLLQSGYLGKIYPINPLAEQILGLKSYRSILEVQEKVEYVVVAVKAAEVPRVIEECVAKGVSVVHIYSAGFGETGYLGHEGKLLEQQIERVIKGGKTRVIGPNCMGVYNPKASLAFNVRFSNRPGTVGAFSQSGAALMVFIPGANKRGIYFSKVVSYGNAIDLEASDFLEYFAKDPDTRLIFGYIEGVKDGRRFMKIVQESIKKKPIIMLKGGLTEGGRGAVASHTGSLAGSEQIWEAFFKQTGVIQVDSFDEAIEQIVAVQYLQPVQCGSVAILSRGGGPSVLATDLCERNGISVPALAPDVILQLARIIAVNAGSSVRNPVEIGLSRYGAPEHYDEALRIVASDSRINMILARISFEGSIQYGVGEKEADELARVLISTVKSLAKPVAVVVDIGYSEETVMPALKIQRKLSEGGLAVFSSMESAVRAIGKLNRYFLRLESP
jgi:acyl-CoA synthetase (NDP forming)